MEGSNVQMKEGRKEGRKEEGRLKAQRKNGRKEGGGKTRKAFWADIKVLKEVKEGEGRKEGR
jgi:hypothetical protein